MVEFFRNLPWWIQLPGKALAAACGGYVSNHPEIFPSWAVLVGAAVALWVVLAFLWHAMNTLREHQKKPRITLEPHHIIILGLFIALGAVIWMMAKSDKEDPRIAQFQKQIATLQNQAAAPPPPPPVINRDNSAETIKKLQGELNARTEELAAATRQIEAQRTAATRPPPVNPETPEARSPYPPGPVLQQPFSREQAQKMLDALGDMAEAATRVSKTLDVPMVYFPPMGGILGRDRWAIQIANDGFGKMTEVMNAFEARVS